MGLPCTSVFHFFGLAGLQRPFVLLEALDRWAELFVHIVHLDDCFDVFALGQVVEEVTGGVLRGIHSLDYAVII